MKKISLLFLIPFSFLFFIAQPSFAQFGLGLTYNWDIYQRYVNPEANDGNDQRSSGNAFLNLGVGPKMWVGGEDFSFSVEGKAVISPTALDINQYKGLGAVAFPLTARFNIGAFSGFKSNVNWGLSVGGGIQYSRTELFGLKSEFQNLERDFFETYFGELSIGFGGGEGIDIGLFVRYGVGPDNASTLNIGTNININYLLLRKSRRGERG